MKEISGKIIDAAKSSLSETKENISNRVSGASSVAADIAKNVGAASIAVGSVAKRSVETVATTVFDQNGDGKLDQEDLKLLTEKGIELATAASKSIASSELVKDTASAAAVGAAIAIPVPFVGPAAGAVVGAALGAYSHVTKKK